MTELNDGMTVTHLTTFPGRVCAYEPSLTVSWEGKRYDWRVKSPGERDNGLIGGLCILDHAALELPTTDNTEGTDMDQNDQPAEKHRFTELPVFVGKIVHYVSYGTPGGEYTSQCRAAVIAEHNWDVEVNVALVVLNPTGQFFNQRVRFSPLYQDGGSWHHIEQCKGEKR